MIRGGISYGPIVFYHPDDDKNIYNSNQINNPFNAIGSPIGKAYVLSEKSKGMRIAVDCDVPMDKYKKYFSKQRDFQGNYYYEILWPLCIFNMNKDSDYIFDSLKAFWHLLEKNRGDHEIQYLSTLALFWKSVDLTSQPNVAEYFFESKLDEYPDEIDYIRVLKKYDFFVQLKNPCKI